MFWIVFWAVIVAAIALGVYFIFFAKHNGHHDG